MRARPPACVENAAAPGTLGFTMALATRDLAPGEWAVLGLLAESPAHGFAIAKAIAPGGEIVYRHSGELDLAEMKGVLVDKMGRFYDQARIRAVR